MEDSAWCLLLSMKATATTENKLWGIYHTDREYAQTHGDPLRTTVEAPTKEAAEKVAATLGLDNPWAHPIAPEVVKLTETVLKRLPNYRSERQHKPTQGIRI